jgi:cell division septal protein FtsQ
MVRKLRGPVKKENKEEKRQRKKNNLEGKQRILTVALPVLVGLLLLLVLIIWLQSS